MVKKNPEFLCDLKDIRRHFDYTGRIEEEDIYDEIEWQEELIYDEFGDPLRQVKTYLDNEYSSYFLGKKNVYKIDKVSYGTASKITLEEGTSYSWNGTTGFVELETGGSSEVGASINDTKWLEVDYVPRIYNKLCSLRVARSLLERMDITQGGNVSKALDIINKKLSRLERVIQDKAMPVLTGDVENYDEHYFPNRTILLQKHSRNKQLLEEN